MCVCVHVKNSAMANSNKLFVCACVHVGQVYWINGQSKKDKKLALLTYMCMRVYVYKCVTLSMGLLFS